MANSAARSRMLAASYPRSVKRRVAVSSTCPTRTRLTAGSLRSRFSTGFPLSDNSESGDRTIVRQGAPPQCGKAGRYRKGPTMDFGLNSEQRMILATVSEFVTRELLPMEAPVQRAEL